MVREFDEDRIGCWRRNEVRHRLEIVLCSNVPCDLIEPIKVFRAAQHIELVTKDNVLQVARLELTTPEHLAIGCPDSHHRTRSRGSIDDMSQQHWRRQILIRIGLSYFLFPCWLARL